MIIYSVYKNKPYINPKKLDKEAMTFLDQGEWKDRSDHNFVIAKIYFQKFYYGRNQLYEIYCAKKKVIFIYKTEHSKVKQIIIL